MPVFLWLAHFLWAYQSHQRSLYVRGLERQYSQLEQSIPALQISVHSSRSFFHPFRVAWYTRRKANHHSRQPQLCCRRGILACEHFNILSTSEPSGSTSKHIQPKAQTIFVLQHPTDIWQFGALDIFKTTQGDEFLHFSLRGLVIVDIDVK